MDSAYDETERKIKAVKTFARGLPDHLPEHKRSLVRTYAKAFDLLLSDMELLNLIGSSTEDAEPMQNAHTGEPSCVSCPVAPSNISEPPTRIVSSASQRPKVDKPIILGKEPTREEQVLLSTASRQYSLYAIGTPGVGKSNLLESIARQDMKHGDGLCFLDPHGDSAQQLLRLVPKERRDDVIFWDPKDISHPIGLNPFYCANLDNPVEVDRKVEDFISALSSLQEFTEVFKQAPQMLDILRHMAFACVLNRGTTLLDTVRFLTNGTYRNSFYPALHRYNRRDILEYWEDFDQKTPHRKEELTSSSLNKLRRLATTSITRSIFQRYTPTLDFRDLIDSGKILLVDLSNLGEGNGELLGAFIVFEILHAAFSRGDIPEPKRYPFYLFADEFERFMTTAFPRIIDEGRKFKLSCVLAHQHRGQLSGASIGSTLSIKNKVIFRVNSADAQELAASFDTTPPLPEVTGYKAIHALSHAPWSELTRTSHQHPTVRALAGRLKDLAFKRVNAMDKNVEVGYPFRLHFEREFQYGNWDDQILLFSYKLTIEEFDLLTNQYLLLREQGLDGQAQSLMTRIIEKFCTAEKPTTEGTELNLDRRNSEPYFRKHNRENTFSYQDLTRLHNEAHAAIREDLKKTLQELGDLLTQEENHIKTESGQYEPVLGPLRTYNDMVGEIANTLTQLPRFQARCILDEGSSPVEHIINTEPPKSHSEYDEKQAQEIIARSRLLSQEAQDDIRHDILPERKSAHDDPSHPLPGQGKQQPPAAEEDDEDDYFR